MRSALLRAPRARALIRPQAPTPTSSYFCRQCIARNLTGRRAIQISASPATEFPKPDAGDAFRTAGARDDAGRCPSAHLRSWPRHPLTRPRADARFEILGSPYSLLSVSLSASQNLYTRRGTLVSVAGKVENAQSTLSLLTPVRRALLGIPFLYQRISSTTPLTLLIGTKAAHTTLFTLHLDGTTDWVVAQRNALLAWTGHTLAVTPQRGEGTARLGLAHWGTSFVTGRGLVALSAPGYVYPVTLAAGEELVVHPSHVVAYAVGRQGAPTPFRLKSGQGAWTAATEAAKKVVSSAASSAQIATKAVRLRLQTPRAGAAETEGGGRLVRFWSAMQMTDTYKFVARALFDVRTVLRRTIWGDRLFVHVRGPATLLLSSRGVRVADVLTRDDVNEIADAEAGTVAAAVELRNKPVATEDAEDTASSTTEGTVAIHVATVKKDGKVAFADAKDLKEFVR